MTISLVCGITGQDGAYLARLLLSKGHEVFGTSRDAQLSPLSNLVKLGIRNDVCVVSMAICDFRSVLQTIEKVRPDEIYNLAGQSSVGLSFEQPVETMESLSMGPLNLLEAIRFTRRQIKLYNACSSECFGDTDGQSANEKTPFRPRSPYAVAKAAAYWQVANYRKSYGIFASSGILFNHESPLRPERFVTKKVVAAACRIADGGKDKLHLGNLQITRDWGWAPEFVDAMWRILQLPQADDFVIATGESNTLSEFVDAVFSLLGLDWREHVIDDPGLYRPSDLTSGFGTE